MTPFTDESPVTIPAGPRSADSTPFGRSHPAETPSPAQTPRADEPTTRPQLVVIRGEIPGTVYPLLPGRNYLGRMAERPIDIDLTGQEPVERIWTSRQHAVVTVEGDTAAIEDLVSLNGTSLNRERLHPGQARRLAPGDVIQVGVVQLRFDA